MPDTEIIYATFERVAEKCADPTALVYARLFELRPEFEPLFDMDTDGGVRGSMLQTCFDAILGVVDGASTQKVIISAARFSHGGYGVEDGQFDLMFAAIRDVFRDLLAPDWSARDEDEWSNLLEAIASIP